MKSESVAAAEHLKTIRQMMERATVYRALSAPAAIFGGLVAIGTAGYFIWKTRSGGEVSPAAFFWIWVGAMLVVDIFNSIFLWKKSRIDEEPYFSPALFHVCLAVTPALVVGGILSYEIGVGLGHVELCALTWILCFGIALLAMGGVAPRSLKRLGWVFLGAGILVFLVRTITGSGISEILGTGEVEAASWIMLFTFGLMFIGHGFGVLLRKPSDAEPA